jgi:hypothetical protein
MIRNERCPVTRLVLALLTAFAMGGLAGNSLAAAPPDAFVCAAAARSPGGERPGPIPGVAVDDQFSSAAATVKRADRLCAPVGLAGSPPADDTTHLVRHGVRVAGRQPKVRGVAIDNALGAHALDLGRPAALLAPSNVDLVATPPLPDFSSHGLDRYHCWAARASGSPSAFAPKGTVVQVTDASGTTRALEVRRPSRLCAAADVAGVGRKNAGWHLACYSVRPVASARVRGHHVDDGFGAATLDTTAPKEVCLPSRAVHACDGAPELCDRRFDEVSYATTHNANSNAQDGFSGPNQQYNVTRQLEDGVRGLMLDTHYDAGTVMLCHAFCVLGKRPLVDTLVELREFLEREPYEVVSIIFESYVSAADTEAAFAAAGLLPYVHAQPVADPWPTLREMIASDRRLVVFTDSGGGTYPWYHHVWNYAFETHYSFSTPADLSCAPNRGNPANRLFILNHFLTQVFGSPTLAAQINFNPLFIDRANACAAANAALPNFVTVDFHDIGDTFAVVDALNGL